MAGRAQRAGGPAKSKGRLGRFPEAGLFAGFMQREGLALFQANSSLVAGAVRRTIQITRAM